MNVTMERSVSLWMNSGPVLDAPLLRSDERADVAIVGAGIAGLSTAYELMRVGRTVVVIDRGPIGGGMSSRTTAHLASALDDFYHRLIARRGLETARRTYASQAAAIDRIEHIAHHEGIACDFARLNGYFFLSPGDDETLLEQEIEACEQIGFTGVSWVDRAPVPGIDTGRALQFPNQGRFHPRKYMAGLAHAILRDGGRIYANTPVTAFQETETGVVLTAGHGHQIHAEAAVVATNSPVNDRVAVHTKQAPYRTYVIAGPVEAGSVPDALVWDTQEAYHYVRLQPVGNGADMLIIGGKDHKTGEAHDMGDRFVDLEAWARRHYPQLQSVDYRWSGQVMEPVDYLPFTGRNHGNQRIYIHTGDSGQGMTNGVAGSLILRDLIVGHENPWCEVTDPQRISLTAAGEFLKENIDAASHWAEHLTGGEVASTNDIPPGQGAILRDGLKKLAIFRDESGTLHVRSATCTHAGCVVHWNPFERCWDCPCHGSHFAVDGSVLNGPALTSLPKADYEE
ncbi:FAD-dependent oxidoreductase [Pedomonas mirosovicensis]|uniref:FAD-dependent oxidoreductase n=1 Tax=Pedomonas mirosovicensis TaxID=2908641 RepID=UPI00216870B9|nr:FAD-dependent oxidoreductase [Pedomonas mirosovicensis]MCH8685095.1 FAD-dependent oxidoreductase [Pedomonas mirosovicensis]